MSVFKVKMSIMREISVLMNTTTPHKPQNALVLASLRCMTAEVAELPRSEPQDSWIGPCLNFHHFDIHSRNQDIWLPPKRFIVTPAVCPRLFEFLHSELSVEIA